jgi:hypothetical protein
MAAKKKKKAAKRRKKATVKSAPKRRKKTAARTARKKKTDRFGELTKAHSKALERGEHHFANLLRREILKGRRRR